MKVVSVLSFQPQATYVHSALLAVGLGPVLFDPHALPRRGVGRGVPVGARVLCGPVRGQVLVYIPPLSRLSLDFDELPGVRYLHLSLQRLLVHASFEILFELIINYYF